jgi:hypothetical protein
LVTRLGSTLGPLRGDPFGSGADATAPSGAAVATDTPKPAS